MKRLLTFCFLMIAFTVALETAAQNVGIGNTNPQGKLDIRHTSSPASPTLLLYDLDSYNYSRIQFQNASGPKFWNLAAILDNLNDSNSLLNVYHSQYGNVMSFAGTGNVGIGTNSPRARLDVHHFGGFNSPALRLYDSYHANYVRLQFQNGSGNKYWTIAGLLNDSDDAASKLNFYHSVAGDIMSISGNGRVGIGTTSPSEKLDVNGNLNIAGILKVNGNTGTAGQVLTSNGTSSVWQSLPTGASVWNLSGNNVFNNYSGYVGLGTTSPQAKLDIRHSSTTASPTLLLHEVSPLNYARLQFQNAGGEKFWSVAGLINNTTDQLSRLNFYHSVAGDVLSLTGDGKVGIGNSSPIEKLDVNGGINLTGSLKVNGSAGAAGQVLTSNGMGANWQNLPVVNAAWNASGNHVFNTNTGNVGVGTNTPSAKLDIRHTSSFSSPSLLLYDNNASNYARLQFQNASGNKFWNMAALVDNANDANSLLNIYHSVAGDVANFTGNGRVGFGTNAPAARVHIRSSSNTAIGQLTLEDATTNNFTRLMFKNTASPRQWTIAALNTNTDNTTERLNIHHSIAGDVLSASGDGKVVVGGVTASNNSKLDVQGGNINTNGKVTRNVTGEANLVPLAYGKVSCAGIMGGGTGNFTFVGSATNPCAENTVVKIGVPGEYLGNYLIIASVAMLPGFPPMYVNTYANGLGEIEFRVYYQSGIHTIQTNNYQSISFVIYKNL